MISPDFGRVDYSADLQELLCLIPSRCPSLEHIEIDLAFSRPHQPIPWVLSKSSLSSCLALRNLRVLDITLAPRSYSPMFTDDELEQMAKAWPYLEKLCIKAYANGWALPTKFTLRGIVGLIKYCPKLLAFSLAFDARKIPETNFTDIVRNRSIQSLDVANSPISSAYQVAAYFRHIMPALQNISTCATMNQLHKMMWDSVSTFLSSPFFA